MMFAIITPALITGAFANRVTFKAYLIFLTAWLLFVYFPFVHMIWGGGMLAEVGRAGLRRRHRGAQHRRHRRPGLGALRGQAQACGERRPHSIPLVALGTGLLWFGWYGFNAGSEFRVDAVTGGRLPQHRHRRLVRRPWPGWSVDWMLREAQVRGPAHRRGRRPGHHHPGAGYVSPTAAVPHRHHRRRGLLLRRGPQEPAHWDDALDVWGVHGVGGFIGHHPARRVRHHGLQPDRRRRPAGRQRDLLPASSSWRSSLSSVWAFVFTYGMLWLIDRITPVQVDARRRGDGPRRGAARRGGLPGGRDLTPGAFERADTVTVCRVACFSLRRSPERSGCRRWSAARPAWTTRCVVRMRLAAASRSRFGQPGYPEAVACAHRIMRDLRSASVRRGVPR